MYEMTNILAWKTPFIPKLAAHILRFYLKILPAYDKSHMLPLFFGLDDVVCPCLFSNGNFRNIQLPWFCPGVFL